MAGEKRGTTNHRSPGLAGASVRPGWSGVPNQILVLVALALAFYANTVRNEYALDDGLVIQVNPHTQRGLAGIPDIFTSDAYAHFYKAQGARDSLPGGRYRPLSIATFALEWQLFARADANGVIHGAPAISHAVNVSMYAATVALLVILLGRCWLPQRPLLAFLAALLFTIHPIHTEAVANIKGRDELLSLFFLVLTLIWTHRHLRQGRGPFLALAAASYFLALLSKENGITFLAVIPLALHFFTDLPRARILRTTLPFAGVAVLFLFIRWRVVGLGGGADQDFMNDPFALAAPGQRLPTILVTLLAYLGLLAWPHPLSYDYGYRHFAYAGWGDPLVLAAIAIHLLLLIAALRAMRTRRAWAFGILFYLITLSIVSNIFFPIGASIGERLVYLPSLGFVLALAVPLEWALSRPGARRGVPAALVLLPLVVLAGVATVRRNAEWKNDNTLFLADVEKVPRSVKANSSAAVVLIEMARDPQREGEKDMLVHKAMRHLKRALDLERDIPREQHFPDVYLNLGVCHQMLDSATEAARNYLIVLPDHPWFGQNAQAVSATFQSAAAKAYNRGDYGFAWDCLTRANELEPGSPAIVHDLGDAAYRKGDMDAARAWYERWTELAPADPEAWMNLGGFLFTQGDRPAAATAFQHVLDLRPDDVRARQGLAACAR